MIIYYLHGNFRRFNRLQIMYNEINLNFHRREPISKVCALCFRQLRKAIVYGGCVTVQINQFFMLFGRSKKPIEIQALRYRIAVFPTFTSHPGISQLLSKLQPIMTYPTHRLVGKRFRKHLKIEAWCLVEKLFTDRKQEKRTQK